MVLPFSVFGKELNDGSRTNLTVIFRASLFFSALAIRTPCSSSSSLGSILSPPSRSHSDSIPCCWLILRTGPLQRFARLTNTRHPVLAPQSGASGTTSCFVTRHTDMQQVMKLCRSRSMRGCFQRSTSMSSSPSPS
ncbi:hypothetical protein GGI43DRAFT_375120 [Trichoderma evansii]